MVTRLLRDPPSQTMHGCTAITSVFSTSINDSV
jgi:hypothetical protein